ncbi:MAG: nitrilase-related carbon-nitrogen hydrolase [Propionibacteriaceae bacterium]
MVSDNPSTNISSSGDRPVGDRSVRVRCHELGPAIGDLERNCQLIENAIHDAMTSEVQLLILPELATSGYNLTVEEGRRCALTATCDVFGRWAQMLNPDAVLVVGFCEPDGPDLYNSAAVIDHTGVRHIYRKTHLWDTEKNIFTPGSAPPAVLDTPAGRLGVLICYDLEFPEMPRQLALAGADLIAVPTNWPYVDRPSGEHAAEVIQAMAAARASSVAIACCDRRQDERGTTWTQGTSLAGTDGWLLGTKKHLGQLDVTVDLSDSRRTISPRNHVHDDRRPELYS